LNKSSGLKKEAQRLTNLISATFGVDVGIISGDLNNIAGTETYYQKIGLIAPNDSHAAKVLYTGEGYFVKELKCSQQCLSCSKKKVCPFEIALYQPIRLGNLTKGVVFFMASNRRQKEIFLQKCNQLKQYALSTAKLISALIEKEQREQLYRDLTSIYNSLDEGVIIINPDYTITFLNSSAENMINSKIKEISGQKLETFLPQILPTNLTGYSKPVELFHQKSGLKLTLNPIFIDGQLKEYVLLIKNQTYNKSINHVKTIPENRPLGIDNTQPLDKIIGISQAITQLKAQISKIAKSDSTILILGETGTGKELCAHAIHELSPRRKGPFVAVNCGAIPNDLLESELFGYEEGAFTGARKTGKPGKFEQANNGTLFLDEIGDLPLHLQVKLLRVLESNKVERLGTCQAKSVNVRIICATNQDLETKIRRDEFREDLYYRINVIPIHLPPLREHPEDIPLLLDFFLHLYQNKTFTNVREFSPELVNILIAYPWPGNIRELRNLVEYICNMETDSTATIKSLPPKIKNYILQNGPININQDELERLKIKEALKMFGNTTEGKRQAARYLGMSLATLYRKLKSCSSSLAT